MIKSRHVLAVIAAFSILGLYGSLVFPLVDIENIHWPIFSTHSEGLSFVTYGKWREYSLEYFLTDALSGEFPVAYNFTSDYLLNILSEFVGLPSAVVHSVIFAGLIVFLFLLLNYYYIYKIFEQSSVALVSALLISYTADSNLLELFFKNSEQIKNLVHVPISSLHLATGQSAGWVLFMPTLGSLYLAFHDEKVSSKVIAGLFIGLLFQTHSLTFINALAVIALFLNSQSLRYCLSRGGTYRSVLLIGSLFIVAIIFADENVTAFDVVGFCAISIMISFMFNLRKWRFYALVGTVATIVVTPYSLIILSNIGSFSGYDSTIGRTVSWGVVLVFFLPHILLAIYGVMLLIRRRVFELDNKSIWLACLLVATLILSQNHLFNWNNHPYRFTINLIFPLSIISAVVLTGAWNNRHYFVVCLGFLVFGFMITNQVDEIVTDGRFRYGKVVKAERPLGEYLNHIQEKTNPENYILLPAEYRYPKGARFNSLVMSYSRSRAFLPDYRYIFWQNRYRNRLRTFCVIFPEYPLHDTYHKGCDTLLADIGLAGTENLAPINMSDQILKNTFIRATGIDMVTGRGHMAEAIRQQAKELNWEISFDNGNEVVATVGEALDRGVGRISEMNYGKQGFKAEVYVENSGNYTLNLIGSKAAEFVGDIFINSEKNHISFEKDYFGEANFFLHKGDNQIFLPWADSFKKQYHDHSDYINFMSVVGDQYLVKTSQLAVK